MGELEAKRGQDSNGNADKETSKENQQEYTDSLEQTHERQCFRRNTVFGVVNIFLRRFEQNDRDCVVQYGFSKNDGVEFWVDLVSVEDS